MLAAAVLSAGAGQEERGAKELLRITKLTGTAQTRAMQAFLAKCDGEYDGCIDQTFYFENELRPALRALIRDPKLGDFVVALLALTGVHDDIDAMLRQRQIATSDHDDKSMGVPCRLCIGTAGF